MITMVEPGQPIVIGVIVCMKCPSCGVTREIERFWLMGRVNKPVASRQTICTYCY